MNPPTPHPSQRQELRQAVVHGCVTIGFALATLVVALASTGPERTVLVVVTPIIVLIGALTCLWRTYRSWQARGRWQLWQGASWFLLMVFVLTLLSTAPALLAR